jgi:hypothetical protein
MSDQFTEQKIEGMTTLQLKHLLTSYSDDAKAWRAAQSTSQLANLQRELPKVEAENRIEKKQFEATRQRNERLQQAARVSFLANGGTEAEFSQNWPTMRQNLLNDPAQAQQLVNNVRGVAKRTW